MRILYLHQYFVPPEGHGGTRSYEFARRLIAQGHDVVMLTSSAMLPAEYQFPGTKVVDIAGIPAIVIPVDYANTMSFRRRLRAFLEFGVRASWYAMRQRADVIFATSTPLTIAIPAIAGHLWQRAPILFEVRDLWPELPIAIGALSNPLVCWLARALEWVAYHSSAHIIALSPGMKQGVERRGIPPERLTVIPNSCDVDRFDIPRPQPDRMRERLGLAPEQPLVVYAGSFGLINGVTYLVRVAAAMRAIAPEIHFLLVGEGADLEKVTQDANATGVLGANLTIWEPIPKVEIPALMATAAVATSVFLPYREMWNNSANKFFDALAAGKPMAINYGGWQADILENTGAGIVLPEDDPMTAAAKLAAFVRDPRRLQAASSAARRLAYEDFNRDKLALELEAVLRRVAKRT